MTSILPQPKQTWLDANGEILAGAQIYTYVVNSTTPKTTWADPLQVTVNTNPVIADSAGRTLIYGVGSYRVIVYDALNNLIYDQPSAATMNDSVISAALLPVMSASTLSEFRDLTGVTAAIAAALAAINLIPGPTGATGATGATGDTGATGSPGTNAALQVSNSNPGYIYDPGSGFMLAFGQAALSTSFTAVFFAKPFSNAICGVCSPALNPINVVTRVGALAGNAITLWAEDTNNHGGFATQCGWMVVGFV